MGAAGQFEAAQEFGHGGDFVALGRRAELAEDESVALRPGADQMHRAAARAARAAAAAQRLAIEGHDLAGQRRAQALGPGGESLGKLRGVEQSEDTPEGVVAGDAVGECEQALEPVALGLAELLDVHKALGTAEQRAEGDEQNVVERMAFGAREARVFEVVEVVAEADVFGHRKLLPTPLSKVHIIINIMALAF